MGTGRQFLSSCGTQTAGLAFGDTPGATEAYNGSTWAGGGTMNTGRGDLGGAGIQTAALGFGGAGYTGATEEYNGTSWATSPGSLNTGRSGVSGCGTQTAGLAFGGSLPSPPASAAAELYDGSTWTTTTSLSTARGGIALTVSSPQTTGLAIGGNNFGTITTATEEYTGVGPVTVTITGS